MSIKSAAEIRELFLNFFVKNQHQIIPASSLVPENDQTVLFNTAGMQPLVPYLLGQEHPQGKRLVNIQKCLRTDDIEEVGDETHLTFFEMMGNWSLGDYFREKSIQLSYQFLTEELKLDPSKLAVSIFAGDDNIPRDNKSEQLWLAQGITPQQIAQLGKTDNWWGPVGETGPCGPDTEIFYWTAQTPVPVDFQTSHSDPHWVEIWNNVFMEYERQKDGSFIPLRQKNIDTGMGFERITTILQDKKSPYETDIFKAIITKIADLSITKIVNPSQNHQVRIIADHLRAVVMMIVDGINPSNIDRGYIVRRLLRRALRAGKQIALPDNFLAEITPTVITVLKINYPELNLKQIQPIIIAEEQQFTKTLDKGLKEFTKLMAKIIKFAPKKVISGKSAFNLYETYGFPLEMTIELAQEQNFTVDTVGFEQALQKHQDRSRAGASQKFQGGLVDHSEQSKHLHTATHLLHQALRLVLGDNVIQKGSNITVERLRFDFSYPEKLTDEQKLKVEDIVNKQIQSGLDISYEEMSVAAAQKLGAIGLFTHKYGEKVRVYKIGDFSMEICGGPHAKNTAELGIFKITKESASSKGIRRIKATLNSRSIE